MNSLWSTLASKEVIGALIGAAGAFIAAMWVARDARKREARSAAMVAIATLGNMVAVAHTISKYMPANLSPRNAAKYTASKLVRFFPSLDPMYGACVARLMPIHPVLAAKLHVVSVIHENVSVAVDRLCSDIQARHQQGAPQRPREAMEIDEDIVMQGIADMQEHCAISQELLQRLVLSRWAPLQSVGIRFGWVGSTGMKAALRKTDLVVSVPIRE